MLLTREWRKIALRLPAGLVAVACLTGVAFRLHLNLSTATSLHLLLVLLIALRWGFWEASLTSLFSVLCLDYFFTQPLFALYMSDAHDWVAMGTFETVALLVSRLSNQTRQHAAEAETQRERMEKLYELSQNVLLLDQQQPASAQMCVLVRRALSLDFVAIWDAAAAKAFLSESDDRSKEEVRTIYAAHFEGDDLASGYSRRLLRTGERVVGAMLTRSPAIDSRSMDAAASLTALAIERSRSFAAESASEGARQSEQLRSAVLDGLAHAFKTPLTTILASSSGLIEMGTIGATERELVALIESEAAHLKELTARLLTTARLDSAHIRLAKQEVDLVELLRGLARVCTDENTAVEIALQVPTHAPSILADIHLLKMALYHLVDNGAKYANPGSRIEMCLQEREGAVVITVKNSGSYIPMEEREHIFERFYRGPRTASQVAGTGIGLAIAKRVVEAHGGNIWVDSDEQNGTEFSLLLPHAGRPFAKASIWTRDA
jgi:two-component system, OmpR family, sensor histidine kinase KdpD